MVAPYAAYADLPYPAPHGVYARVLGPGVAADVYKFLANVGGVSFGKWVPADVADRITGYLLETGSGSSYPVKISAKQLPLWVGDLTFLTGPDRIVSSVSAWPDLGIGVGDTVLITGTSFNNAGFVVSSITTTVFTNDTIVVTTSVTPEGPVAAGALKPRDNVSTLLSRGWVQHLNGSGIAPVEVTDAIRFDSVAGSEGSHSSLYTDVTGIGAPTTPEMFFVYCESSTTLSAGNGGALWYMAPPFSSGQPAVILGSGGVNASWWTGMSSGQLWPTGDSVTGQTTSAFEACFAQLEVEEQVKYNLITSADARYCQWWSSTKGRSEDSCGCRQGEMTWYLPNGSPTTGDRDRIRVYARTGTGGTASNRGVLDLREFHVFRMT